MLMLPLLAGEHVLGVIAWSRRRMQRLLEWRDYPPGDCGRELASFIRMTASASRALPGRNARSLGNDFT